MQIFFLIINLTMQNRYGIINIKRGYISELGSINHYREANRWRFYVHTPTSIACPTTGIGGGPMACRGVCVQMDNWNRYWKSSFFIFKSYWSLMHTDPGSIRYFFCKVRRLTYNIGCRRELRFLTLAGGFERGTLNPLGKHPSKNTYNR